MRVIRYPDKRVDDRLAHKTTLSFELSSPGKLCLSLSLSLSAQFDIYMLFNSRKVRIGKNCARGLGYRPRPQAEGGTQDRGHSFSQYGPT